MEIKKYTYKNRIEIDKINIHDTYFEDINIGINTKKIFINIFGGYLVNKSASILFENIINFEINKLELWGKTDNRILDLYLEDDGTVIEYIDNKIKQEQQHTTNLIEFKQDKCKFINVGIRTNAGDTINIVCEEMIYMED